jgi:hypothetical protein
MRLNLTNNEAAALMKAIDRMLDKGEEVDSVRRKLGAAADAQGERDEFRVGNVRCERKRGSEFSGYDRRSTSNSRYGWLLTHEPTGTTEEIPPSRNDGISKRAIALFAASFGKRCEATIARAVRV